MCRRFGRAGTPSMCAWVVWCGTQSPHESTDWSSCRVMERNCNLFEWAHVTEFRHRILEPQFHSHATHTSNRSLGFVDGSSPQFLWHHCPAMRSLCRDTHGRNALSAFKRKMQLLLQIGMQTARHGTSPSHFFEHGQRLVTRPT